MRLLLLTLWLLSSTTYSLESVLPYREHLVLALNDQNALLSAIQNRQSNIQVTGSGRVVKLLKDDNSGSRHQKFLVKIPSGHTVLIAHNIDLAPRVSGLRAGDMIEFCGEFEWNPKGGVIHWTHHDPRGHHDSGWLRHHGQLYQ